METTEPVLDWTEFCFSRFLQYSILYVASFSAIDFFTLGQYSKPQVRQRKFDSTVPGIELRQDEALRGLLSIMIVTLIEVSFAFLQAIDVPYFRQIDVLNLGIPWDETDAIKIGAFFAIWGEFHFYVTHRMLHKIDLLYRHVHSVHHLSKNTDTWSGLSFHPVESLIYFSALTGFVVFPIAFDINVPYILFRFAVIGLIITPALIHQGHDVYPLNEKHQSLWYEEHTCLRMFLPHPYHHYQHHKLVTCNFGGFAFWDEICGTSMPR